MLIKAPEFVLTSKRNAYHSNRVQHKEYQFSRAFMVSKTWPFYTFAYVWLVNYFGKAVLTTSL